MSETMQLIIVALLLTLVGAGTGLALGTFIVPTTVSGGGTAVQGDSAPESVDEKPATTEQPGHGSGQPAQDGDHGAKDATAEEAEEPVEYAGPVKVLPFPPVLTTLAEPKGTWIRLEGSVLVAAEAEEPPELLAEKAGEQILSYLRTLRLDQLEGTSGMMGLREDLNETVRVLSGSQVRGVLIHGLLIE